MGFDEVRAQYVWKALDVTIFVDIVVDGEAPGQALTIVEHQSMGVRYVSERGGGGKG